MKTSDLLQEAYSRVSPPHDRSRKHLAVNSLGLKTHPTAEDVEAYSSVGTLMKSLETAREEGTPPRTKSIAQKMFFSSGYSYLMMAARQLGFSSVSELDEFGTDEQFVHMWENAISTALVVEQHEEDESNA